MIIDRSRVAAALPGYELGVELGTGAFGLVLAARHRELNRPVAVKIVPAGTGSATEAQLLASLDHPHIVRFYNYVEAGELYLLVMELLGGGTLARRVRGMPGETACAVGLAVAAALACAHGRGVLHRDIKPSNVLFDTAGLLKVTDFGIAKLVEGSAATASAVVGTPAYMAPEQITGGRLGPTTDLYALGVVLYQLLTGKPLFDPALPVRVLWQHHIGSTPAPLAGVPTPVAQVVLRALAKQPAARQPSVNDFALDLAEAAADAYGPCWAAESGIVLCIDDDIRNAVSRSSDHLLRASHISTGSVSISSAPATNAKQAEDEPSYETPAASRPDPTALSGASNSRIGWSRRRIVLSGAALLLPFTLAGIVLASGAGGDENPTEPRSPTQGSETNIPAPIPTPTAPAAPASQTPIPTPQTPGLLLEGHTGSVSAVAFAPDGRILASGSSDSTVRLWDVADRSDSHPLGATSADPHPLNTPGPNEVSSVAFSPDGRIVASGNIDGTMRLWDVTDPSAPRPLATLASGGGTGSTGITSVSSVAFSADGRTLTGGSANGTVRLWDVADRSNPHPLARLKLGRIGVVYSVVFSPDGRTLAGVRSDGEVRLWDVADRSNPRLLATLESHTGQVYSMSYSPDGRTLVTGSANGTVQLWDVTDPSAPLPLSRNDTLIPVLSVRFAPDGRTLVSGSDDGAVWLWEIADPANPHPLGAPLGGRGDDVVSVAFSSDVHTLASGNADGTVRVWTLP